MSVSIYPSGTLGFPRPLTQSVKRTLTITNNNAQSVAFRVKTTAPRRYCVKPNSGRVAPGQSIELQVTLQAMEEEPPLLAKCKDKFMVQSVALPPGKEALTQPDIWNTPDVEAHSHKLRVSYLSPERPAPQPKEELAPVLPIQPPMINPVEQQQPHTTPPISGRGTLPIQDLHKTRDHAPFEGTGEAKPAPPVSAAIRNPSPRPPTPQPKPPQDQHLRDQLAETTAELNRLKALLGTTPGKTANEESRGGQSGVRKKDHGAPSTVTGTETDVTGYVDEAYQPESVPFPRKHLEKSVVSGTLHGSPSPSDLPPHVGPSVSTVPQPQPKSTPPETVERPKPSNLLISKQDRAPIPGTWVLSPTEPGEDMGQGGGEFTHLFEGSEPATRNPTQKKDDARSSDEEDGRLSSSSDENNASGEVSDGGPPTTLPMLPPPPTIFFSREGIMNDILDLTVQAVSFTLSGPVGIGKSSVALTLLHNNQTKAKFRRNRYFMRCDDLTNSVEDFLERLSDTLRIDRTANMAQLRSHLKSSPPLILVLDGADSILDPLTSGPGEISAIIGEFGNYERVCLVTTSRVYPDIRSFRRVEVPAISEDGARDTFYNLCNLGESPAVNDVIARLDCHPLSINLLANCVRENNWDEQTLLKAWDDDQTGVLRASYRQKLRETVETVLRSPTIQRIGTTSPSRDVLEAIVTSPYNVEESGLERRIPGAGKVVDTLCKFSLAYRQNGLVKMLTPIRSSFLEFTPGPGQRKESLCWDVDSMPGAWSPKPARKSQDGCLPGTNPQFRAPSSGGLVRSESEPVKRSEQSNVFSLGVTAGPFGRITGLIASLNRWRAPAVPVNNQGPSNTPVTPSSR